MISAAEISERLCGVRESVGEAAGRSGRLLDAVKLVLASKTQPAEAITAAYAAGARDFGENYVQEAVAKRALIGQRPGLTWHMIGHLQTNKARVAAATFALIHTLDSAHLARALARFHQEAPLVPGPSQALPAVLIEVNLAGEGSKAGVRPAAAEALIVSVREMVAVNGLMTIPPRSPKPEAGRRWFAA